MATPTPLHNLSFDTLPVNGLRMRVAQQGAGPLVLLCHGFPESWYSWRHQLAALAAAGYRAVAPDMRGYGGTDAPVAIVAQHLEAAAAQTRGDLEGAITRGIIDHQHVIDERRDAPHGGFERALFIECGNDHGDSQASEHVARTLSDLFAH